MTVRAIAFAALAGIGVAACQPLSPAPTPVGVAATQPPLNRFVAAVEAEGCVFDQSNVGAVLLRANLTQAELPPIIADLEAQGRIETPSPTQLRILSDNCI
jgi:hypothetical protein